MGDLLLFIVFMGGISAVGASLLAKIFNDNAPILILRGVLECFASKLAPTEKCKILFSVVHNCSLSTP
ncbi:hypothetical protein CI807_18645 [Pseudomonas sp. NS1(2017)]|nr:hypothetical protein CI807_18645 [Pseudomonas sp. NS1(2017)]